ncbi:hypothetical protein OH76DRAFT_1417533 [Lentinus brumalis]|uniref:BTB domain-containing protein n=1 Tax=Lentinus brumalis TaxID=2498619 RepID=A0A371DF59_9APHY|nr:hypothetical protein OH76DRAFT_1417533 [Polyporus brumalis]
MAQPSAKRPRTDETSGDNAELQRDGSFWFEDGNIVVVAQQTAFRVHKGVLSRHSDTFSGLFTVPQPSEGAEQIDGCPVVRISDSAHDFDHLLRVLYDGLKFFSEPGNRLSFDCLSALARLGHKYELPQVLSASVNRLKAVFTTDFAVWKQHKFLRPLCTPSYELPIILYPKNCVEAISLFRTLGHPEMLPIAFYLCVAAVPLSMLLRGVQRADGTLENLAVDDLERFLMARDRLTKEGNRYAYALHGLELSPSCRNAPRCMAYFAARRNKVVSKNFEGWTVGNVLHIMLRASLESALTSGALCADCVDAILARQLQIQQDMWLKLPEICNLDVEEWPVAP